jgi:hypothetical protein
MGRAPFDDLPLRIDLDVRAEISSSLSDLGFGERESSSGDSLDVSRALFRACLSALSALLYFLSFLSFLSLSSFLEGFFSRDLSEFRDSRLP